MPDKYEEKKRGVTPRFFSSFLLLYPKSPAETAVKDGFEIRNIKIG